MKKIALLLAVTLMVASAYAQALTDLNANELGALDLSGKYVGKRFQFTPDRKAIMQTFQYEFELQQTGNIITGTSTIIKENGDYADMKLRGTIVGNKLYFEEYEIQNQIKDPNMVWCYKSGALTIQWSGDQLKLSGITDSYMADYYLPCTGGTTDLTKVDNSNNLKRDASGANANAALGNIDLGVAPNPFVDATKINYTISDNATVTLEVYDITGRRVAILENGIAKNAGSYSIDFSAKAAGLAAGVLIAKLTVNGQVYSSEMVQMK